MQFGDNPIFIVNDGNSLFRCFSLYLFNRQASYKSARQLIVKNVIDNWYIYASFIIGRPSYPSVLNIDDYSNFMSIDRKCGGEAEIMSFSSMYQVHLLIHFESDIISYGNHLNSNKLVLRLTIQDNQNYYSIIEYQNSSGKYNCHFAQTNISSPSNLNQINNKRKLLLNNCPETITKKIKLSGTIPSSVNTLVVERKNNRKLERNNNRKFKSPIIRQKLNTSLKRLTQNKKNKTKINEECFYGEMDYICRFVQLFIGKKNVIK